MPSTENLSRFSLILLISAIINVILYMLLKLIIGLLIEEGMMFLILNWVLLAGSTICAITISVWIIYKVFPRKIEKDPKQGEINHLTVDANLNAAPDEQISLLFQGFTLKQFPMQIKDGILLFLCIYVPLDFLSYLIPGVLDYTVNSLNISDSQDPTNYFLYSLPLMLVSTLIVHFLVAVREEFLYREFFLTLGRDELKSSRVFFYSAIVFGLAHFNYIFVSSNQNQSVFFPIWWALNGFTIGLFAGGYFWKKKRIIPVIMAHWFNNVFSAVVVRLYYLEYPFWQTTFIWLYIPALSMALILYLLRIFKIEKYLRIIHKNWKRYLSEIEDWKQILLDIGIILLFWLFLSIM